ncbi:unnamed protein product [Cuscuta campestris]|uniref:Uncharacterized protein n=1 Tax=Cuscuta campestris TaxID=132261 RepID=A0A484N3Q3_9ASTE|nr:unnamed protein product [Cuscuta campestris]
MGKDKSMAATSGRSKSKSRAPTTSSEERLYYGDGSYLWFDSEEERTRFLTFFSKRVVAPPRIVSERFLELQGYDDLDAQLHQAGLWPFVSRARKEINPVLIRVFYSNLWREGDVLYSLDKSTPIELSVEQLGRIAGLPYQGDDVSQYGGEDWVLNNEGLILTELGITELIRHASGHSTIHSANPESRLLLYIVSRIIKPRKHGHTIMSGDHHSWPTHEGHVGLATAAISTQTFKKRSDNVGLATAAPRLRSAAGPGEPMDDAMNAYFQRVNYVPPPYHGTFFGQVYGDEDEDDASYAPLSSPDEDEFDDAIDGDDMDDDDDDETGGEEEEDED